jgi:hypothetical protein
MIYLFDLNNNRKFSLRGKDFLRKFFECHWKLYPSLLYATEKIELACHCFKFSIPFVLPSHYATDLVAPQSRRSHWKLIYLGGVWMRLGFGKGKCIGL